MIQGHYYIPVVTTQLLPVGDAWGDADAGAIVVTQLSQPVDVLVQHLRGAIEREAQASFVKGREDFLV
jgi:hypothetical protein